ncbi:hypothetical protein GCM10027446_10450 [Angustibacter peucedani]
MTVVAPVRRQIRVGADPATAFTVFTAHVAAWWPLGQFSLHGATSSVAFEGDELVERAADGSVAVWAEVVERDAPHRLRLAWHPGQDAANATDLLVTFTADGDGTLVQLEHSGWERTPDPEAAAANYSGGWVAVLAGYAERAGGRLDDESGAAPDTWWVLEHRPGPAVDDGGSVFAHPLFAEHVAFLGRLADQGLLVAAGPLPDVEGAGLTVVRVPGVVGAVDVVALATADDRSVAEGLLAVQVRPWAVRQAAV